MALTVAMKLNMATLEELTGVAVDFASGGNVVGSGDKTLDLSGTGTDGVRFSFVAGT